MAGVAADPNTDLGVVRNASPALHAALALLALLVATALGVYKPRGMTRYGWRKQHEEAATGVGPGREATTSTPRWVKVSGSALVVLALLFIILLAIGHLTGHGTGGH